MGVETEIVTISSDGLQLYGRLRARDETAPTFVLLCGLGFHTFEFEPLVAELAEAGMNSLSFDYRGHGRSDGHRGRWTLAELAADCRHALDFLDTRTAGPVVLLGNSLGAMVAILTASQDPRPLAVAAANAPAHAADFLLTRPRRVLYTMLKGIDPLVAPRVSVNHFLPYQNLIDDPGWIATFHGDPLITDARRFSVRTYRDLLETWDGPDAVRLLHRPLLVIQGRNDRMQPPRQSELIFQAAHQPKRYELLDTGHLPHLEEPALLTDLLTRWLPTLPR